MDIARQLTNYIQHSIQNLTGLNIEPKLSLNSDLSKGDFSSNIAMRLAGKLGSPMEAGEKIVKKIKQDKDIYNKFEKIELIKPGFINFWLKQEEISKEIERLLNTSKEVDTARKSQVMFEFGDPNPFKEPHIGHLRNFALGDSISRLLEEDGYDVIRASYQGDVGMHVAKALWGMQKLGTKSAPESDLEAKAKFLGEAYALGSKNYEENDEAKAKILEINKQIYAKSPEILDLWEKGRKWSLDYFELIYKRLGLKYDKYYFESETAPLGLEIVEKNIGKVFEKDNGAIVFRGEEFGLHTRVFVTKEGYATYEGKDLALGILKDKDYPGVASIIMTANEQTEYFKVMLAALKLLDEKIHEKTTHLSFGFVNLKDGKMSSRTGNIVPLNWLLEQTSKRLKKGFKEVSNDVLEQLSIGAVKWTMLKFSRESNIAFSIEESVQIEGNSGPYMQYAYARANSVLKKSSNKAFEANPVKNLEAEELALARIICQFGSIIKNAKDTFSPNILTNYLFNLAQAFNHFYEKKKIIGDPKEETRLALTFATAQVLKKGLYLLGISAPEKI